MPLHPSPTPSPSPNPNQLPGYRLLGRFNVVDPLSDIQSSWSGSTIEANFSGTSLSLGLEELTQATNDGVPVNNLFSVWVDDAAPIIVATQPNTTVYPIDLQLASGNHRVIISRRTEAFVGPNRFTGLKLSSDGVLLAPPPPLTRHVEFVGASSMTGYGADANVLSGNDCHYTTVTQDAPAAYPGVTADALQADWIDLAFSGKGLLRNRGGDLTETMPVLYNRQDPAVNSNSWDFNRWTADAVVIGLGGNDFALGSPDHTMFVATYVQFLRAIRSHYPNALLVVAMDATDPDPLRSNLIAYLADVVPAAQQAGLDRVIGFTFTYDTGSQGYGCDGHPDLARHRAMANELMPILAQQLNWPLPNPPSVPSTITWP